MFWPSMGWIRAAKYAKIRLIRLADSSSKIALGLAIGVGISFTPFLGTHFVQAGILSYLFRANFLASLMGTFIGNPWTFPFIWWAGMSLGSFLFELMGFPASAALPEEADFGVIWELIKTQPMRVFAPWCLGGYLLCFLTMPLTYAIFFRMVRSAKQARRKARERMIHQNARSMTGQKK